MKSRWLPFLMALVPAALAPASAASAAAVSLDCRATVSVPLARLAVQCAAAAPVTLSVWIGEPGRAGSVLWARQIVDAGRGAALALDPAALGAAAQGDLRVEISGSGLDAPSWVGVAGPGTVFDCDFESGVCGIWGQVVTPEVCNGVDDDCDTFVDECPSDGIACTVEACSGSACASTPQDALCDDGLGCTNDVCTVGLGCANTDACTGGASCCPGGCTDLDSDLSNCGFCGNSCSFPNAFASCQAGACFLDFCDGGYDDCDSDSGTGCETWIDGDPNNCGGCNLACSFPNGSSDCIAQSCLLVACDFGYDDCNVQDFDGCETATDSDVNNCGGCNLVCDPGDSCVAGACVPLP